MQIDPAGLPRKEMYKLLTGSVVPRPIAWVSSISAAGVPNIAPFSYFNIACVEPPMLLFCPQRHPDGSPKDTLRNVTETGEFVLHLVSESLVEVMNQTSAQFPPGMSEFDQARVMRVPAERVVPPRVADAPVAFECGVEQIVRLGDATGADIVIGRVLLIHIADEVYRDSYVILDALRPVARLAGSDYARVTDTFSLPRPVYDPMTHGDPQRDS
jgi:flavin reductase (DIM6/NTAB) family NADH-FMN oxidoreductase RutF